MRTETRLAFTGYLSRIAELNGVDNVTATFTTAPTIQQTLEDKMQETSEFLSRINMFGVTEQEGEKVMMAAAGPLASRTNTNENDRAPRSPIALSDKGYRCEKTNSDTFIKYALLDAWAKFPDFETRIRDHIIRQQARDRIMIGWNGTHVAQVTDLDDYPLLQDLNKGWIQKMRDERPAGVISEGNTDNQIRVGTIGGQDFRNMDALVFDMIGSLIEPWYREDTTLVCILGRELLHDKYFPLVDGEVSDKPSEQLARDVILSTKRVGGLQAVTVPFFPARSLAVTSLDNLSLYYQNGARRRMIQDNPKRDRIDNFESSNDAYVVEEVGKMAVAENIVTEWAPPAP